jgi:threonine dehydratase
MKNDTRVTLRQIYAARKRTAGIVRRTPLISSSALSNQIGVPVYLKLETLQETGSFKVRGAANKMLALSQTEREHGVIAFSTGNHGRAVAYVGKQLGIATTICLSDRVPQYRVEAMKQLGADVLQHGSSQDEAYDAALKLEKDKGLTMINPFDDPLIIAGQGTIGLEVLEDLPEVDTVLVPLSGGGLISGVARAVKTADPKIRVIGVSMECAPAMYHCIRAGKPVEIEEKDSLADALLGGIGLDNQYTFAMVRDYVDDIVLVSEEAIAGAMFFALDSLRLVVEGAGAVGIAALLNRTPSQLGKNVVVVLSGGNVDVSQLTAIASKRYRV